MSMIYTATYPSPFGPIHLACNEAGTRLTGLWVEGQKYQALAMAKRTQKRGNLSLFDDVKTWLDRYFAGDNPNISDIPLAPEGSDFRQEVWSILCDIPYGEITTYGEIANIIAKRRKIQRMAAQAVGGAVGHNPIAIIIPCHRVLGAKGNLTGYGGGIDMKIRLLELEGVDTSRFFIPEKGTAL